MTIRNSFHRGIVQRIREFSRSEDGSIIPLVGICFMVIMGVTGMAIDIGRAQLVESKLLNSIDAAGLAAGAKVSTTNVQAEVEKFVHANYPDGYVDSVVSDILTTTSADAKTITVSAKAVMKTSFMKLFGVDEMTVAATSEISRGIGGLELALVLDNTGSMGQDGKLDDLKVASKDLLNVIFGNTETADKLFVGIVPFSKSVNIGTGRTAWLTGSPPSGWDGCVRARTDTDVMTVDRDTSDDPPSVEALQAYNPSGCPDAMTAMTNIKGQLVSAIEAMTDGGHTHVNFGAVWGWRMVSPRWRAAWASALGYDGTNLPLDYGTPTMNKAVVIMTDGENTMPDRGSAYGDLDDDDENAALGTTSKNAAVDELDDRLLQVCTNMKNAGVTVYTVAFGNPGANIEAMMEQCASQPDFFFNSANGEDLSADFRAIGDSLASLRVSK